MGSASGVGNSEKRHKERDAEVANRRLKSLQVKKIDNFDAMEQFREQRQIFEPAPFLTISGHSEKYRVLPKQSSFDAGAWVNRPYQILVQDAISSPEVEEVVLMTSAQSSKTEILLNTAFYYSDVEPSPILIVQPTFDLCGGFSKDRLTPSITESPQYRGIFGDQSVRGESTLLRKQGNNGSVISFGSMSSLSSLASKSIRVLLVDELDRCKAHITPEGNIWDIMSERTSSFPNRKICWVSTPKKIETSHIYSKYLQSDQSILQVRCMHCNGYFDLVWETVVYDLNPDDATIIKDSVGISCRECGGIHSESQKSALVENVRFRVRNPSSKIRGFNYGVMANDSHTLFELVEQFESASHDPDKLEAFYTLKMGVPFRQEHIRREAQDYDSRLDDYTHDDLPDDILFITNGIDVQGDRFEITTWGFGFSGRIYHIDYYVTFADTAIKKEWRVLLEYLDGQSYTLECGVRITPHASGLDSGYQTKHAYDFAQYGRKHGLKIYALKGGGNVHTPMTPFNNKKVARNKQFNIGTFQLKDMVYKRVAIEEKLNDGFVHFSRNYVDDDFFKQLHSERKTHEMVKGRMREQYDIIDHNVRNEVLDTFCYGLAAFYIARPNLRHLNDQRVKLLKSNKIEVKA